MKRPNVARQLEGLTTVEFRRQKACDKKKDLIFKITTMKALMQTQMVKKKKWVWLLRSALQVTTCGTAVVSADACDIEREESRQKPCNWPRYAMFYGAGATWRKMISASSWIVSKHMKDVSRAEVLGCDPEVYTKNSIFITHDNRIKFCEQLCVVNTKCVTALLWICFYRKDN